MKIALIGNMNNNNFSIMRYFRDLGADAHLLLYANDGQGSLSHFKPESDTWDIEKWKPFIHQTSIPNAAVAALSFPFSWLISFRSLIRSIIGFHQNHLSSVTKQEITKTFGKYPRLVGSGIAPAVCHRVGLKLDIFYPYSTGVEFLDTGEFVVDLKDKNIFRKGVIQATRAMQEHGLCQARYILNAELGITKQAFEKRGVTPIKYAIPMVYNRESTPSMPQHPVVVHAMSHMANSKFTLLSHSRLMWRNPGKYTVDEWRLENKNNHWLLFAFKDLVKLRPELNPLLLLLEYGPDVEATKELCIGLGIESNVLWLPKMDRKYLMWLLEYVNLGIGEFYEVPEILWGGTGWEVIASGTPLMQGFQFSEGQFESTYCYPPPPMLPVRSQDDILKHLIDMADRPEKRAQIGKGAKEWFNRYNGIGMAKLWLDLLMTPRDGESGQILTGGESGHGL
jgi:hypothetical protein